MQFGGNDAQGVYGYDIISGAPINWLDNQAGGTQISGAVYGYPSTLRVNRGDGSGGATLSVDNIAIGSLSPSAYLDVYSPNNGTSPLLRVSSVASNATTTRFTVTNTGTTGVNTSTPVADFQATDVGVNATTTLEFGKSGQNKGTCIKLYRTDGSAIYASVAAGASTFTLSTSPCASVTGF